MARDRADPLVNASGGANGASRKDILIQCGSCLKTFKPKSRLNRFCSSRCRLRAWALDDLFQALETGKVDGLKGKIREFGGTG
jgi:endogenous inhibitor of DNA gyrase (YacG/DUF329 family)